ncbi:hypothetical protein AX15_002117 [Amanita polypyramis BW_CC]|nr:hypothetical protein AX15_002117 [Amanita polypyramis BW_CC]
MIHYLVFLSEIALVTASIVPQFTVQDSTLHTLDSPVKVPVELGVMSRCPDAALCENLFDRVLQKVSDKMELSLRYVAKLDPSETEFGVRCMHGPDECAGNVQQLCVAKYSPSVWWEYIRCQNFEGREKIGKPALALKCAAAVSIDWATSDVGRCAGRDGSGRGAEGIKLLQENVVLTKQADITKSCTVVINSQKVCIHDSIWKECENGHTDRDFAEQIKDAYNLLNNDD